MISKLVSETQILFHAKISLKYSKIFKKFTIYKRKTRILNLINDKIKYPAEIMRVFCILCKNQPILLRF